MDGWWIGTVSALSGAVVAAVLQAWRDRIVYQRLMRTRWDETLLNGLIDYLATADRALRALQRWRKIRNDGHPDVDAIAAEALRQFELLHEKSHVIALLTGPRGEAVRLLARQMREPLLPLRDEVLADVVLDDTQAEHLDDEHRNARSDLIKSAQLRLGLTLRSGQ